MTKDAGTQTAKEWPVAFTQDSIKKIFVLFTIFYWIGYPLTIVGMAIPPLCILGVPLLITAVVFDCIILYRQWWLLQGHGARTTPGKAVGFSFIPFFNFYWWFVAYAGLVKDNNAYMDKAGIQRPKMSYGLALSVCIVGIIESTIGLLPILNIITAIPGMIIGFLFVLQQKNAILAIMNYREKGAKQAAAK